MGFWVLGWVGFCWGVLDGEGLRQHVQVGCGAPHFDLEGIGWGVGVLKAGRGFNANGQPLCPGSSVEIDRIVIRLSQNKLGDFPREKYRI